MIYRLDNFTEHALNPVTGQAWDGSWIIFMLTDGDYTMFCGSVNGCAYTLKVSRKYAHWPMALGDFIGYNSAIGKNIILVLPEEEYRRALDAYGVHTHDEPFLRVYESPVLIHSTTPEGWAGIQRDGCLKSWNQLHRQPSHEAAPIGTLLGDPAELRDFILFGSGVTGEIVVSSRQKGRIEMDVNAEYTPGARLYFDMARIARDGLLVRDGSEMKVRDALPLAPYLLWAATPSTLGMASTSTPHAFTQAADVQFQRRVKPDDQSAHQH